MSDPIANMFSQLSNANHKFKETVEMPSSNVKVEIARVLKEEGFINHYKMTPDSRQGVLKLTMKYTPQRERVIQGIKRVSRPGLRLYKNCEDIPSVQNGLGVAIMSTSKGVLSSHKAREKKVGGEVLGFIW